MGLIWSDQTFEVLLLTHSLAVDGHEGDPVLQLCLPLPFGVCPLFQTPLVGSLTPGESQNSVLHSLQAVSAPPELQPASWRGVRWVRRPFS